MSSQKPRTPLWPEDEFLRKLLTTLFAIALLWVMWLVLTHAAAILVIIFAGMLFASVLRGLAVQLSERTPLSPKTSVLVCAVGVVVVLGLLGLLVVPRVSAQLAQAQFSMPQLMQQATSWLEHLPMLKESGYEVPPVSKLMSEWDGMLGDLMGVMRALMSAMAGIAVVCFVALYLAMKPALYEYGVMYVLPDRARPEARRVLMCVAKDLRWWMIGRLASMAVVGVLTALGLWLVGVPLALSLGIIAALLSFIPMIGPALAFIPALLFTLQVAPDMVVWTFVIYGAVQVVESYLITPLIQERAAAVPPVILFIAQLFMGTALGPLGVIFATPIALTILSTVKQLRQPGEIRLASNPEDTELPEEVVEVECDCDEESEQLDGEREPEG